MTAVDRAPAATFEPHTDCPDLLELAIAYEAALPMVGDDKVAAAVLAVGAVLADTFQRSSNGGLPQ